MNRVEELINQTGNVAVLWKQYISRKKKCLSDQLNIDYFCFYEGKDDCKYYNVKLEQLNLHITHFDCKGKYKLLKFRDFMRTKYGSINDVIYFIDKDYDDKVNPTLWNSLKIEKDIYTTPCYSIENFYTINEVFKKLLVSEYHYTICCKEYDELLNKFNSLKKEFHDFFQDINYWYATYRLYFEEGTITYKIVLNDFKLTQYIDLDFDNEKIIVKKNLLITLQNLLPQSPIDFQNKLNEMKKLFSVPSCEFRGKFELFFLTKFIEKIKIASRYNTYNIDTGNILSNIVQYTERPQCLDDFVTKLSS